AEPADLGEPAHDLVRLPARGACVMWIDGFGNLVTNVRAAPRGLAVNGHSVSTVARTFSEVARGELLCYVGSMGYVEIGAREARADELLKARLLDAVSVL
ncbi:MAG: SAM hydroxide adenosyltransferase, partial [Candidatus Dormibacterales bacterium]